jgi:hypothetical protein
VATVGRHHTFETAIADLVDNSIDAEATDVLIRFVRTGSVVVGLQVIDDGHGMDATTIDNAMTFAGRREYGTSDLGHFGLGLKAASLSQADVLNVYSRTLGGVAVGRTIRESDRTSVEFLDGDDVERILDSTRVDFALDRGTVVEWRAPRTFLSSTDPAERTRWLEERVDTLRSHLGVVFHRLIAAGRVRIRVDEFVTDWNESGAAVPVLPIDPFKYVGTGATGYPATIRFAIDGVASTATVHVWPANQSGMPEFRLGGRPGVLAQGFYFYRHGRLLQVGGWNTLVVDKPELEYARVAVDIDDRLAAHVTINPEKAGLELDADFKRAITEGRSDAGASFADFIAVAEGSRREARRYTKHPVKLAAPDRGFGAEMIEAFADSVEYYDGEPVNVRWRVMRSEAPFELDIDGRTIWLNEQFRSVIARGPSADQDDVPLVKTLLMIVFSKYFEGMYLGSREREEVAAWEQLLTAALRDEIAQQARGIERNADE